jgi:aspartyl-tRNA(Asn)/glutamyl-tRNA(Gln) amidotransferase subunit C
MDIEELRVTAALAHITMSESELAESFPAFEQMLVFFQAMQAADNDKTLDGGVRSDVAVVDSASFRPDSARDSGIDPEIIIKKAGETDGRFMVIPNVL